MAEFGDCVADINPNDVPEYPNWDEDESFQEPKSLEPEETVLEQSFRVARQIAEAERDYLEIQKIAMWKGIGVRRRKSRKGDSPLTALCTWFG